MKRLLSFLAALAFSASAFGQILPGILGGSAASCADANWSSVTALYLNENGSNGSSAFVDQSASALTITNNNTALWTTTSPPTGLTSTGAFVSASSQYLTTPANAGSSFGTGDFTIEMMVNFTTLAADQSLAGKFVSGNYAWLLTWQTSNNLRFYPGNAGALGTIVNFAWTPSTGTWYHLAWTRSGTDMKFWVNGTQQGATGTNSQDMTSTTVLTVGRNADGGGIQYTDAKIGSFRITKGVARYTGTFTPPTLPLPTC